MTAMMVVAGIVKLMGWFEVELGFFGYDVTSRQEAVAWTGIHLGLTVLFGYLFWRWWAKR